MKTVATQTELEEKPWLKYLDGTVPTARRDNDCLRRADVLVATREAAFMVTQSVKRATKYQRIGQPVLMPEEIHTLEMALKGTRLPSDMISGIAKIKHVLGGKIVAAHSLARRE